MKIITIEEHFESVTVGAAMAKAVGKPVLPEVSAGLLHYMKTELPTPEIMQDTMGARLDFMNAQGIGMQVLSYGNVQPQNLPATISVELCQLANDELAKAVAQAPDRFAGLACLPIGNPEKAAEELERAVKNLGLKGALLKGNFDNRYFDDEFFFPIFEKAAELDVPIYFHPSFISPEITKHYFDGPWSDVVSGIFSSAGFGWHMDVGIQMMRMVLSGIFDKLPNLKLISGHWGEGVGTWFERLDEELAPRFTGLAHDFTYYYKHNIWISPSGIFSEPVLKLLIDELGAERLMYSVDYPYKRPANSGTFLAECDLSDEVRELIAYKTATKLFHLN